MIVCALIAAAGAWIWASVTDADLLAYRDLEAAVRSDHA